MTVLVTGGSGFIGSHVVDKLIERNYEVRVFDVQKPHRDDVKYYKGDIKCLGDLSLAMEGVDYVFHIAASSNIDRVSANPLSTIDLNIGGTARVLESARKSGVERVLLASSYFVGGRGGHLYATSKAASEMLCKDYYTLYGLPFTILRYGTVYGPGSRGEDVVSVFVQQALSSGKLVIHGSGSQYRHFIYVDDLAEGNVAALKKTAENETYILASIKKVTIKEVAQTIKRLFDDMVSIEYKEERIDDYEGSDINLEKTKKELRWEPKVDFEEGVRQYIEWHMGEKR